MDLIRVSKRHPCPVCGKPDWCGYNTKKVICMRVPNDHPAENGGWVHLLGPDIKVEYVPPAQTKQQALPPAKRSHVYRAFLSLLTLTKKHIINLQERGLTFEAIRAHGYKSLPLSGRAAIARKLLEMGYTLKGVPGFYQKEGSYGPYWTFAGSPGLLIPYQQDGLIMGLQIRADDPLRGKKYIWFSSFERPGGSCPGAPFHIAAPATTPPHKFSKIYYITEGALKANIAAEYLRSIVIAVPGTNTWQEVPGYLASLEPRPLLVAVAYDMDLYTNKHVMYHYQKLQEALNNKGLSVVIIQWDPRCKGIDDLLTAGGQPILKPPMPLKKVQKRAI